MVITYVMRTASALAPISCLHQLELPRSKFPRPCYPVSPAKLEQLSPSHKASQRCQERHAAKRATQVKVERNVAMLWCTARVYMRSQSGLDGRMLHEKKKDRQRQRSIICEEGVTYSSTCYILTICCRVPDPRS